MNKHEIKVLEVILDDLRTEQGLYGTPGKRYWLDSAVNNLSALVESENAKHHTIYNILATRPGGEK